MHGHGETKYRWGQRVLAAVDLVNDGSHPQVAPDALLVALGTPGEVVRIGCHESAAVPVYLVEFATDRPCVVGVFEAEIEAA